MQPAYAHNAADEVLEPVRLQDLHKSILIPRPDFEAWLELHDWTYHQLARQEFPAPYAALDGFQLACICADPGLWCPMFLREPEDPDHDEPYGFWDFQRDSLRFDGATVHKCAAEIGKTREIVAWGLWKSFTVNNGSGLIGAPQQTHLEEIIEAMHDQMVWNPDLGRSLKRWKKNPHHAFYFTNSFKIDFRPSGFDGEAYRGVHARTFAIKDEAAKDKNKRQWSEFWRAIKPGCVPKIYSVPDGDRSCEFYKLGQRATPRKTREALSVKREASLNPQSAIRNPQSEQEETLESFDHLAKHIKTLKFTLFQWAKPLMPDPYWSEERRRFYVEQYGGEDAPEYKHNVLGEDGDPEHTIFPWHQFKYCIKDIPEYRALKIIVDAGMNEVIVTGYKCNMNSRGAEEHGSKGAEAQGSLGAREHGSRFSSANGPVAQREQLIDTIYMKSIFFDFDADGESEFTRLIKSFFNSVPGAKRGGGDFGFSDDVTEITVKSIIGKKERLVSRLHLKHVTYDQQCQALNAVDDVYGASSDRGHTSSGGMSHADIIWGTDFGNAGSAVAHDLQGLEIYKHKSYDDRLKGFMFESTTDNINEDGEPIIDAKTQQPSKITLKELATDILVKKMQRQELEYPPDPDIILYYTNHTVRTGGKHRIYKKEDDHLIDSDRMQILAKLLAAETEDLFA